MFHKIDYNTWDHKEVFELFYGYTYCVTADIDITEFLDKIHIQQQIKFYPAICYCIGKVVNENRDYRLSKVNNKIGYWDTVDVHYTLRRKNAPHLFTHKVTKYTADFSSFYKQFLEDKKKAEVGDTLYFDKPSPPNTVHISTLSTLTFKGISYSKPVGFTHYDSENTSFIPFVTVGKYSTENGRYKLPLAVEFHHAVNDGYHVEQFFHLMEECCENFTV